jgi:hypothetical protein
MAQRRKDQSHLPSWNDEGNMFGLLNYNEVRQFIRDWSTHFVPSSVLTIFIVRFLHSRTLYFAIQYQASNGTAMTHICDSDSMTMNDQKGSTTSKRKKRKSVPAGVNSQDLSTHDFTIREEQYYHEMGRFEERFSNNCGNEFSCANRAMMGSHGSSVPDFSRLDDHFTDNVDDAIFYLNAKRTMKQRYIDNQQNLALAMMMQGNEEIPVGNRLGRHPMKRFASCNGLCPLDEEPVDEWVATDELNFIHNDQILSSMNAGPTNSIKRPRPVRSSSWNGFDRPSSSPHHDILPTQVSLEQKLRYEQMRSKLAHITQETRRVSAELAHVVEARRQEVVQRGTKPMSSWSPERGRDMYTNPALLMEEEYANIELNNFQDIDDYRNEDYPTMFFPPVLPHENAPRTTYDSYAHIAIDSTPPQRSMSNFRRQSGTMPSQHMSYVSPDRRSDRTDVGPLQRPDRYLYNAPTKCVSADVEATETTDEVEESKNRFYPIDDPALLDIRFGMSSPDLSTTDIGFS